MFTYLFDKRETKLNDNFMWKYISVSVFFSFYFNFLADSYIVAWKRGIAILSAGAVKVTPDPRVRLVNGFSLQIRDAVPQDAGDYICQIATMEPREITHTVEILGKKIMRMIMVVVSYIDRWKTWLDNTNFPFCI